MGEKMVEIRWHARGGQGAKTAATLVAAVALEEGKYSQGFPDYGPEREGAPVRGYTRISDAPVQVHSAVYTPDIVVVLDPTLLASVDVCEGLKDGGIVLVNSDQDPKVLRERLGVKGGKVFTVNATQISIDEIGRAIPNTPMMGALMKVMPILKLETILKDVEKKFKSKGDRIVQGNFRAIRRAFEEVKEGMSKLPNWKEMAIGGIIPTGGTSVEKDVSGWRTYRPIHSMEKCIHCLRCWILCPDSAIQAKDGRITGIDYQHCKGCGICAAECPRKVQAITMKPESEIEKKG